MQDDIISNILSENERRLNRLEAQYDPITGEGLAELLGEKRVKLVISDYAIPEQWVPQPMMENRFVKEVAKAGSIESYIENREWKYSKPCYTDIERYMRRVRHKYDFCAWAFFCIQITHKKLRKRVRFTLNLPQLSVLGQCEKLRNNGELIDLIILKARQWGGSTFCFFYQCWLMFKWNEFHSFAIAAHTASASQTILNMLKRTIQDYPAWDLGLPDDTELRLAPSDTTGHAFVIKDGNDKQVLEGAIFIGTAENPDALRSKDICGVHYSEVGIWPDTPNKRSEDIIADIQGGLLDGPDTMQVMESTAKSSDDYFHDVWMQCVKGSGGYHPVFIPAYMIAHDAKDIADKEEFARWLLDNKEKTTVDGKWRDNGKYYWWLWESGATLEHINWYRYRRLKLSFAKMCNEAPETPEQAFFTAGNHVFDPFMVAAKSKRCTDPVYVGELTGDGEKGEDAIRNIGFISNSTGTLHIWEMPDDSPVNDRYIVVVDPGGPNETSDPSSIRVIDRLLMMPDFGLNGKPSIVAERNYHTDLDKLAFDAARLAEWYGHALLVIEANTYETHNPDRDHGIDGFEYILDILAGLYDNLYMRRTNEEDIRDKTIGKWGFHTNSSTKPKIINFLKECLRDDLWTEPSSVCCAQLASYMEDHGKTDAQHGKHDDVVLTTAIGLWICFKELPLPTWKRTGKTTAQKPRVTDDYLGITGILL